MSVLFSPSLCSEMMPLILYRSFPVLRLHSSGVSLLYVNFSYMCWFIAIWMYLSHSMMTGSKFLSRVVTMRLSIFVSICNNFSCC